MSIILILTCIRSFQMISKKLILKIYKKKLSNQIEKRKKLSSKIIKILSKKEFLKLKDYKLEKLMRKKLVLI